MIAVIGGVRTTVRVKLMPPEMDIEKQRKQDEEALLQAGIDLNRQEEETEDESPEDERFRLYYESKMREQASADYWSEVGFGSRDFGGYDPVTADKDSDIKAVSDGCSYNVAKLLSAKDNTDVSFISVVGNDALGLAAKAELEAAGVDVSGVKTISGTTPIGVELHNMMGDLEFCRENSMLTDELTPELIDSCASVIESAEAIFLDGTVPAQTLRHISEKYSEKCRIFFDPGSIMGGAAFAESELKAYCVMPGRMEAEAMSGQQILGMDQLMSAGEKFEAGGIQRTIITLKGGGLYYKEGAVSGIIKPERVLSFADTKGSGDVLSAEVVYSSINGSSLDEAAAAGMTAAGEYLADADDMRKY